MESILRLGYKLLDKGLIPDFVLRRVIRLLVHVRLREIDHGSFEANHAAKMKWIDDVKTRSVIADVPAKANEQHYEVSTKFMLSTLGPHAKYSCCLYSTGKENLAQAEKNMLENYCEKAGLVNGMEILDLGCGWGSLCLFLAEKYPDSKVTGLSNSTTQKVHIDSQSKARGLSNLEIITADVNSFDFNGKRHFDRILSIEMFEHMKNYKSLFHKVSTWLRPTKQDVDDPALLFVHIFCHKSTPYHYVEDDGWMAQNFFSGGTMPSLDLFTYFQDDLTLIRSWFISGKHYSRTCEDWLSLQDKNHAEGIRELEEDAVAKGCHAEEGKKTFYRFRVFYMACSELFNMNEGQEWGVGHYLFKAKS